MQIIKQVKCYVLFSVKHKQFIGQVFKNGMSRYGLCSFGMASKTDKKEQLFYIRDNLLKSKLAVHPGVSKLKLRIVRVNSQTIDLTLLKGF